MGATHDAWRPYWTRVARTEYINEAPGTTKAPDLSLPSESSLAQRCFTGTQSEGVLQIQPVPTDRGASTRGGQLIRQKGHRPTTARAHTELVEKCGGSKLLALACLPSTTARRDSCLRTCLLKDMHGLSLCSGGVPWGRAWYAPPSPFLGGTHHAQCMTRLSSYYQGILPH